jgi:hypothetical protein
MPDHVEVTPGRWLLDTIMEQWGRLTTHGIYTEAAQRGLDAAWSAGTLPGHPEHRPPPGRPCERDMDPWTARVVSRIMREVTWDERTYPEMVPFLDWRFGHGALDPPRRRHSEPWGTRHG